MKNQPDEICRERSGEMHGYVALCGYHVGLTVRVEKLEILLARSVIWIGKAQADGAFMNCASPHGAERLLDEIRVALEKKG